MNYRLIHISFSLCEITPISTQIGPSHPHLRLHLLPHVSVQTPSLQEAFFGKPCIKYDPFTVTL